MHEAFESVVEDRSSLKTGTFDDNDDHMLHTNVHQSSTFKTLFKRMTAFWHQP